MFSRRVWSSAIVPALSITSSLAFSTAHMEAAASSSSTTTNSSTNSPTSNNHHESHISHNSHGEQLHRVHPPSFGTTSTRHHNVQHKPSHVVATQNSMDRLAILSGSAHPELAEEISRKVGIPLCKATMGRFADGEVSVQILENIRGKDLFIIQPCAAPVNDSIMELLLTVSCAQRSNARRIVAVIPYFGYKHHRRGNAISTKHKSRFLWSGAGDFAAMLQELGCDHVIAVDMQRPGQGLEACFFDNLVPVETIVTTKLFIENLLHRQQLSDNITIVAPNAECYKKAKKFQKDLQRHCKDEVKLLPFFSMDTSSGPTDASQLVVLDDSVMNIKGRDVVIVDDMLDTGVTLEIISQRLHDAGAKKIILCAAHGLFTENAIEIINRAPVTKIIVSDSLPLPKVSCSKIEQVSIANYLADVIVTEHLQHQHPNTKEAVEESFEDDDA